MAATLALALSVLAGGLAVAQAVAQAGSLWLADRHMHPAAAPPRRADRPPVSLIRPVCGLDPMDAATLGSTFGLTYPDCEVLFCLADPKDPALPLLQALTAAHPRCRARILIGDGAISGNPKLNNVAKGWAAAASDWIVMADSNLLLPPDYLDQLLARFGPGVGMVSSPAYASQPQNLAAHLECAYLNTHQARWQLAADALGRGYAQGKTLFFHRPLVEAAGGLAVLGREMGEDVAATKITRAAGRAVRLPPAPFATPLGQRGWAEVWRRQARWARVRRLGFPGLYALEGLSGFLPFAAMASLAGTQPATLILAAMAWYGAEWLLAARAGWPRGPIDLAMWALRDLLHPWLWLQGWRTGGFSWRGTPMQRAVPAWMAGALGRKAE